MIANSSVCYNFQNDRFLAATPAGRYDTNLRRTHGTVRWVMSDAPLQSLAPQTFMRDFYMPGLVGKTLDCVGAESEPRCVALFRPLPDLHGLNRTLPIVKIAAVRPSGRDGTMLVDVEATEGVDPAAPNGKTRSELHDLRLFRDGHLVLRYPEPKLENAGLSDEELFWTWGLDTKLPGSEAGATVRQTFEVAVPTTSPGKPVVFSAYAFNDDRVKGETATFSVTPPAVEVPRPRRAYVIAVGVDVAGEPAWKLNFAAADARSIAAALGSIPGRPVTTLALTSTAAARVATADNLHDVLKVLATGDAAARGRLIKAGVKEAEGLAAATPDDVVVLTFSGHGWADNTGAFFMVPAGGRRLPGSDQPDPSTLISAADLTEWLRGVDAGEMAMVIDACQSAASVDAGDFKPGPMGDPGLGQLAFDKGIRILVAAQANEEAQEDPALGQGLLTYTLVNMGLRQASSTDLRLDDWLKSAAARLPTLAAGRTLPSTQHVLSSVDDDPIAQRPALFDFTGKASEVLVRKATP